MNPAEVVAALLEADPDEIDPRQVISAIPTPMSTVLLNAGYETGDSPRLQRGIKTYSRALSGWFVRSNAEGNIKTWTQQPRIPVDVQVYPSQHKFRLVAWLAGGEKVDVKSKYMSVADCSSTLKQCLDLIEQELAVEHPPSNASVSSRIVSRLRAKLA